jgi:hypothetical protein
MLNILIFVSADTFFIIKLYSGRCKLVRTVYSVGYFRFISHKCDKQQRAKHSSVSYICTCDKFFAAHILSSYHVSRAYVLFLVAVNNLIRICLFFNISLGIIKSGNIVMYNASFRTMLIYSIE